MKTSKRKPNSIFDEQVKSINSFGIGTVYKVKDMRNRMSVGKHNTDRVGDYHLDLLSTKCIKRVKRGYYEVVGIIPSFLTLNMCEANRGYTTYGPNPKYLGKSDKYGQNGCYDEWYVNNEKPRIQVERGKKWKLGEPNPFFDYWKTFAENNKLIKEILEESKEKKEEVKPEPETERKINLVKEFFSTENPGKCLTAINGNVLVIIVSLNKVGTHALVKYPNSGVSDSFLVAIAELKHIIVSFESVPEYTNKKEQIVNILKQGLSASDAADLILKLK
jgi:hypothetical protein